MFNSAMSVQFCCSEIEQAGHASFGRRRHDPPEVEGKLFLDAVETLSLTAYKKNFSPRVLRGDSITGRGFGDLLISRGFRDCQRSFGASLAPNPRGIELFRSQCYRVSSASFFVRPHCGMASSLITSPVGLASEEFVADALQAACQSELPDRRFAFRHKPLTRKRRRIPPIPTLARQRLVCAGIDFAVLILQLRCQLTFASQDAKIGFQLVLGRLAQLVRALARQARGHRFESRIAHLVIEVPMRKTPSRAASAARTTSCLLVLGILVAVSGCGNSKPYPCVKVSGKISYDDGSPIAADRILLTFISQSPAIDPKIPPRNGEVEVDVKTGQFGSPRTFAIGDGIIAGDHKVVVRCIVRGNLAKDLIPMEYTVAAKTPLTANSNQSPFDFKIPKPGGHRG